MVCRNNLLKDKFKRSSVGLRVCTVGVGSIGCLLVVSLSVVLLLHMLLSSTDTTYLVVHHKGKGREGRHAQ